MKKPATVMVIVLCSIFILTLNAQAQGNLNPPLGPPQPTMRTLLQVEPRTPITNIPVTISQPGSYYLTTNFTITSSGNGITISADNVTIDLMGFTLDGDNTGSSGIEQNSIYNNATVLNGSLINWQSYGVLLAGNYNRIENVLSAFNTHGIQGGNGSLITTCRAISNNLAVSGIGYGFLLGEDSAIRDCISSYNAGSSYGYGIYAHDHCRITRCTVSHISAPYKSYGIYAESNAIIEDCSADLNGGLDVNWTEGIETGDGSLIVRCHACWNGTNSVDEAIYLNGSGGSVIDCIANNNPGRGIMVVDNCLVRGNICNDNYTGIYAYGSRNRIEGNTCIRNSDDGISIAFSTSNNFVICNFAAENDDNINVASDNVRGQEVTTMTNHPWANFSRN